MRQGTQSSFLATIDVYCRLYTYCRLRSNQRLATVMHTTHRVRRLQELACRRLSRRIFTWSPVGHDNWVDKRQGRGKDVVWRRNSCTLIVGTFPSPTRGAIGLPHSAFQVLLIRRPSLKERCCRDRTANCREGTVRQSGRRPIVTSTNGDYTCRHCVAMCTPASSEQDVRLVHRETH